MGIRDSKPLEVSAGVGTWAASFLPSKLYILREDTVITCLPALRALLVLSFILSFLMLD